MGPERALSFLIKINKYFYFTANGKIFILISIIYRSYLIKTLIDQQLTVFYYFIPTKPIHVRACAREMRELTMQTP